MFLWSLFQRSHDAIKGKATESSYALIQIINSITMAALVLAYLQGIF